jgi:hypothetical protein
MLSSVNKDSDNSIFKSKKETNKRRGFMGLASALGISVGWLLYTKSSS